MSRIFKSIIAICLLWNIALVVGVITNQSYAFERAAGGQFDNFPIVVRIAYILNLAVVIYQAMILLGNLSHPRLATRILFILGILSVAVNAFSQSPLERWNVIPAAIISYALLKEMRKYATSEG
jgi:hypothetical protein